MSVATTGRALPEEPTPLFVYGSLTVAEVMEALLGERPASRPATAVGWRAARVRDRAYPALVRAPGVVTGAVLPGLGPRQWQRVDLFEAPSYALESIVLDSGETALTYVWGGDPAAILPDDWDVARFRVEDLDRYVELTAAWVAGLR